MKRTAATHLIFVGVFWGEQAAASPQKDRIVRPRGVGLRFKAAKSSDNGLVVRAQHATRDGKRTIGFSERLWVVAPGRLLVRASDALPSVIKLVDSLGGRNLKGVGQEKNGSLLALSFEAAPHTVLGRMSAIVGRAPGVGRPRTVVLERGIEGFLAKVAEPKSLGEDERHHVLAALASQSSCVSCASVKPGAAPMALGKTFRANLGAG
jgi:hypothetical protein